MSAMMGMPMGMPAKAAADQEVGDQIKSDITVGGKKNKTHYGKKFGKKHKSAMLDFTKSLWMQDAAASLRNVLKSSVRCTPACWGGWNRIVPETAQHVLSKFPCGVLERPRTTFHFANHKWGMWLDSMASRELFILHIVHCRPCSVRWPRSR